MSCLTQDFHPELKFGIQHELEVLVPGHQQDLRCHVEHLDQGLRKQ